MRDLLKEPLWREEDLGKNLPDSPHATSVALPLWRHVVGYEENDPAVLSALSCGYPRFVAHPYVRQLFEHARQEFACSGEQAFVFPTETVAQRCARYVREKTGLVARVQATGVNGLHAVVFPDAAFEPVKKYWQHFGEIVSSRAALAAIEGRRPTDGTAKGMLRERIASLAGGRAEDVFLYPSGMAALAAGLRAAQAHRSGGKSAQLGFPYVDLLKIQSVTGPGVHFLADPSDANVDAIAGLVERETLSAVFCEVPGNPLLQCVDLPRLSELLRKHGVPLIVDDTPGTFANIDVLPWADMVVSSLTKSFSGVGDVMAGSVVLNPESALYNALAPLVREQFEDLFWEEDAAALEENSRDFPERMQVVNKNAEALTDYLAGHPAVERVYYPKQETRARYERVMRPGGGYSCLLSLLLKDAPRRSAPFYDALRVCKGPSLGLNFTISCPYVLLAHYNELDWVEQCGLSRFLLRISVGMEPADEMIGRFEEAFQLVGKV
ncbi:MAG: PLP-dependent transferase [Candidatus Hydrogenedentes bacterium]|nr:PLP-dependent transferase [Candidatus Hydrogenedentota bacterium]MBI3117374.1 PLP-dependent transferase [Candidatus Hydrogenedentota bacterium]